MCGQEHVKKKRKKRLAIITICDMSNFGNRLQNYAVETVLGRVCEGYEIETLELGKGHPDWIQDIKRIIHCVTDYRFSKNPKYWKYEYGRHHGFRKFTQKYLHNKKMKTLTSLQKMNVDYFIFGSDQIWNATWYDRDDWQSYVYIGRFCTNAKKIAYSASFGREDIPEWWRGLFQEGLEGFYAISVREEAGAAIIKGLIGQDVPVLIDPTLMLTKEAWMSIMHCPSGLTEAPYILCYFLGDTPKMATQRSQMVAKEKEMQIIDVMDKKNGFYHIDPGEFLYLLSHAGLILTDSFHACTFSVLFQKPFLVYTREGKGGDMISRIETLLNKLDLKRKYVESGLDNDIFECDYGEALEKLKVERRSAEAYLCKVIKCSL